MAHARDPWLAVETTDLNGANRRITVGGVAETTNGNQTPHLNEANPQGINPAILILDLTITASGVGTTVLGVKPVTFTKPCGKGQYQQVHVQGAGVNVTVDVQVVHS